MNLFPCFPLFPLLKKTFVLLAFFIFANIAAADVFMRTTAASAALNGAGGMTVYSADAEINGSPVKLAVRIFAGESNRRLNDALARVSRSNLIVIPSPIGPTTIVISIDGAMRGGAPSLAGIPTLPDFTPGFSAANHGTKTRMVSGASPFPPAEAMRSAAAALTRQGWHPATPGATTTTCAFFTKGNSIVLISAAPREIGSALMVMVKQ